MKSSSLRKFQRSLILITSLILANGYVYSSSAASLKQPPQLSSGNKVGNAPVTGRKESRAIIAMDKDEWTLSKGSIWRPPYVRNLQTLRSFSIGAANSSSSEPSPKGIPSDFEQFKSKLNSTTLFQDEEGTPFLLANDKAMPVRVYFVEEDLALNELELRLFHQQSLTMAGLSDSRSGAGRPFSTSFTSADPAASPRVQSRLRAAVEEDRIVRWIPGSTLTYCILKWTFDSNNAHYELVKSNMQIACRDWMNTCNIRFQHLEALDTLPRGTVFPVDSNGKRKVLFVVANMDIGNAIAMSFFPNDSIGKRLFLVDPDEYFGTTVDKIGILRHELGHILGFRHEHISPDAPVWTSDFCRGESSANSTAITRFDRASVMHYPCASRLMGGALPANLRLEITDLDRSGSQAIYGPPNGSPTDNFQFRDFDPSP